MQIVGSNSSPDPVLFQKGEKPAETVKAGASGPLSLCCILT
jgi:hypothetical protein